ncbi:TetR/AcrR family transcriptional regulator, partial [Mycolicibacterium fallax]|uniref:TetR/AcrR family transcriptional regulator n=1 Tax=Mycolicibacterium fallax TaxID=1793 RepID=UPI0021F37833
MPRPRQFDEAAVIAEARDVFWTRGYASTSLEDLTTATGLGKGSLYGAFGDKRGLFLRALDAFVADALGAIRRDLQDPRRDAYDRLVRHIRAQVRAVTGDKRGLFLRALDAFVADALGAIRRDLQDPRRDAYDRLVRHIRAQVRAVT